MLNILINCQNYFQKIYQSRFFWAHLTLADLRAKYRRSALGMLWAILQPLALALLLSFVMGNIFKISIKEYLPFIFSGLIVWEFISSVTISGCNAFVNAEIYIKQFTFLEEEQIEKLVKLNNPPKLRICQRILYELIY